MTVTAMPPTTATPGEAAPAQQGKEKLIITGVGVLVPGG